MATAVATQRIVTRRKYGVHMLQPPDIIHFGDHVKAVIMPVGNSSSGGSTKSDHNAVETFLDDNADFLEDYVQRKVHRSKLEEWLFKPDKKDLLLPSGGQKSLAQIRRQRSRSFTPLRKLSASRFEEGGLITPILMRHADGQPCFIRSTPTTATTTTTTTTTTQEAQQQTSPISAKASRDFGSAMSSSVLVLLHEMFSQKEALLVAASLCRGAKSEAKADKAAVFWPHVPAETAASGQLFEVDAANAFQHTAKVAAGQLVEKCLSARKAIVLSGADKQMSEVPEASAVAVVPIICSETNEALGALRVVKTAAGAAFSAEEEGSLRLLADFGGLALSAALERKSMYLEVARSEVFLELAHTIFREQNRLEPTMRAILSNFLTMIDCEKCQIVLSDPNDPTVFKRIFGLSRADLNEDGQLPQDFSFDSGVPINADVATDVAATGTKINVHKAKVNGDVRGAAALSATDNSNSLLCMPIRDSANDTILGVISLVNKDNFVNFSENDERFAEAFAVFCGIAIRNAADGERAAVSEAKLQVAFETMNYQASASEDDAKALALENIPSAATFKLDMLDFSYLNMQDIDIFKSVARMFIDFGLLSSFNIDYTVFCRWLFTVKKNYRNDTVKYHNWYHAFNVTQLMFSMLKATDWVEQFSKVDLLGLMVASLCHDLDHRGTTNSFQKKVKHPLATLYSSSTLERHHLNQCITLLNIPGNRILERLTQEEYTSTLSVIERCILATDLAQHFKHAGEVSALASSPSTLDLAHDARHRTLVQATLMTAADLGAITKPWPVQFHVATLLAEEFYEQGDLERQCFDEAPAPMMDRQASLALVQVDFVDGVCLRVYEDLSRLHPALTPMLDACVVNREHWHDMARHEETGVDGHRHNARNL